MRNKILAVSLAVALSLLAADRARETKLQQAIDLMGTKGDLPGAAKLLEDVAKSPDRNLAARGLLYLGDCREKLGQKESRQSYERIVHDFADQKEVATEASKRLAGMGAAGGSGRLTTERIANLEWPFFNIAVDRPLFTVTDWTTGDVMLHDLVSGEIRNLTKHGPAHKGKEFAQASLISADGKMVIYGCDSGNSGNGWSEIRSVRTDGSGMRTHVRRTDRAEYLDPIALSPDNKTAIIKVGDHLQTLSLADNSLKPFGGDVRTGPPSVPVASFSPDGAHVVIAGPRGAGVLLLANADGGSLRTLLAGPAENPLWTPDGKWILFISNRTGNKAVWAISPGGGEPRLLKDEQGISQLHGVARDGSVYYSTDLNLNDVYIAQLDPATLAVKGEPRRFIDTFLGRNRNLNFSPDGKWVAWSSVRGRDQAQSVMVRETAGGEEKEVPMPGGRAPGGARPRIWFSDSKALLTMGLEAGQIVYERAEVPDGRAMERYAIPAVVGSALTPIALTPDGNALLAYRTYGRPPKPTELVRYDLQKKTESVVKTDDEIKGISRIELSPDGKQLALIGSLVSGTGRGLFVMPAAGGKLVKLAQETETEGLSLGQLVWTPDSKWIVYAVSAPSGGLWNYRETRAIPAAGGAPKLIPVKGIASGFDPNGRLAYTVDSTQSGIWVAHNLLPSN